MAFLKEACVEGLNQALNAQKLGADRIELCANLDVGGTTPSTSVIKAVLAHVQIPVRVIIRPRGGDFVYLEDELALMEDQIMTCKALGAEGVVFGVLNKDNTMDIKATERLISAALPLKITIHKAVDETPDIYEALKTLESLGQNLTLLTSGGAITAEKGKHVLKRLVALAGNAIEILPAGKIDTENIQALHEYIAATSYHGKRIVGKLD